MSPKYALFTLTALAIVSGCAASASSVKSSSHYERRPLPNGGMAVDVQHSGDAKGAALNASVAGALFGAEGVGGGMGIGGIDAYGSNGVAYHRPVIQVIDHISLSDGYGGRTTTPRTRSKRAGTVAPTAPVSSEGAGESTHMDAPANPETEERLTKAEAKIASMAKAQKLYILFDCENHLKQNLNDDKSAVCKRTVAKKESK